MQLFWRTGAGSLEPWRAEALSLEGGREDETSETRRDETKYPGLPVGKTDKEFVGGGVCCVARDALQEDVM